MDSPSLSTDISDRTILPLDSFDAAVGWLKMRGDMKYVKRIYSGSTTKPSPWKNGINSIWTWMRKELEILLIRIQMQSGPTIGDIQLSLK